VPAADFVADELLYLPRNLRSHRLYGFSPVEQIALTINIALRRERATAAALQHRLDPGFPRDAAERLDGRSDPAVPGLFRRADVRKSRAPAHGEVYAGGVQADGDAPAAAEGYV
jgi:hypothetical protein